MSAPFRNQINILVRFSYLAESGFRVSLGGIDAARTTLYDTARLERRFALFEGLALPSLMAQSERDFTLTVLTGTDLPRPAMERLRALIAPLADAQIVALPPLPMFAATRRALDRTQRRGITHLTSVRMDDDDAIDTGLVARLAQLSAQGTAMMGAEHPLVIAHQNGLFLELSPSGNRAYGVVERFPIGIGLAMVTPAALRDTIFSRNHRLLPQFYTCLSDVVTPSFIRSVHVDNDADPKPSGQVFEHSDAEIDALLKARFATNLVRLRALAP